jgi:hypothetical protein
MDALPPTNRTLDEMDAAARDMGIVPGDPAYAFYTGLRGLYAEQQAGLAQAIDAIKAAQPKITDEQCKAMGNQLVRSFDRTAKRIASGLTVKAFAVLAAIAVALLPAWRSAGRYSQHRATTHANRHQTAAPSASSGLSRGRRRQRQRRRSRSNAHRITNNARHACTFSVKPPQ